MNEKKASTRWQEKASATSPVVLLKSELLELRRELRETVRAYAAGLEIQLAESVAALQINETAEEIPRERLHQLRDLTAMVRKRKLKPAKGRRKDLRKIDALITDLRLFLPDDRAH